MSGEKYMCSNEEEINTSENEENNSIPEEKRNTCSHSKIREKEQSQTLRVHCSHGNISRDLEHNRQDIVDLYRSKKPNFLSSSRKQPGMQSDINEKDVTKLSKSVSTSLNLWRRSSIDYFQDKPQLFSSSLNTNPEAKDKAKCDDRENSSTYICDKDLVVAGPSYVNSDICNTKFDDKYLLEQQKPINTLEKSLANEVPDYTFSQTKFLKKVKLTLTEKKAHQCDQCPKTFSRKRYLDVHKKIHSCQKNFECEKCHKKFTRKSYLVTHLLVHTGDKPYECENCHKKFGLKQNLLRHLRIHTGEKPYNCDKCGNSFSNHSNFVRHKKNCGSSADRDTEHQCHICHKNYTRRENLMIHYRTHTGEKPYECEQCHKKFSSNSSLNSHYRTHSGEKPYECEQCHKKFSSSSSLNSHYRTHAGEKAYECEQCHKKFSRRTYLKFPYHIHTDFQAFKCKKCEKTLPDESKFRKHGQKCRFSAKK